MSVGKTKSGSYQVKWRENGIQKAKNFERKIDASNFEANVKIRLAQGLPGEEPLPGVIGSSVGIKFSDFAQIWLKNYGTVHKGEESLINDRQIIRDYLVPAFGQMDLDWIKKRDIARLQGQLSSEGRLKPKTINNIVGLAHTIFAVAVEWEYLRSNPCEKVPPIEVPEQDFDFWTFEERDQFLSWSKRNDEDLYDIIAFAVNTGLRKGEMRGLLRDCIDFERRMIIVRRSYSYKTGKLKEHTKSKKIRRVPMNDVVFAIMKKRFFLPMTAQVFDCDFQHIVQRWFRPAQVEAGVHSISFHDLRHTFASLLAMAGVSIFDIQKLLGHSDIKTTMRYMHLAPEHLSGLTDVLLMRKPRAKLLEQSKPPESLDKQDIHEMFTKSSLGKIEMRKVE
jgi:integrase